MNRRKWLRWLPAFALPGAVACIVFAQEFERPRIVSITASASPGETLTVDGPCSKLPPDPGHITGGGHIEAKLDNPDTKQWRSYTDAELGQLVRKQLSLGYMLTFLPTHDWVEARDHNAIEADYDPWLDEVCLTSEVHKTLKLAGEK